MTIVERIQLHKLGYTKEEINELAKENYDPKGLEDTSAEPEKAEELQTEPERVDTNAEILKAIQGLTATIQKSNIVQSRQPEQAEETAEDILSKLM